MLPSQRQGEWLACFPFVSSWSHFQAASSKLESAGSVLGVAGRYKDKAPSFVKWSQCHFMGHLLHCKLVLWWCCFNPQGVSRHPKSATQRRWCLQTWQYWPSRLVPKRWPYLEFYLSLLNLACDHWRAPGVVLTESILLEGFHVFVVHKLICHELLC